MRTLWTPGSSLTPSQALIDVWRTPMGGKPWTYRVFAKLRKWVNFLDHSQGHETIRTYDLTPYIPFNKVAQFVEEVEDHVETNVIKASQINQKVREDWVLIEESGGESSILPYRQSILDSITETALNGESVHLWVLEIWVGQADKPSSWELFYDGDIEDLDNTVKNGLWLYPPFEFIYGMHFAPEESNSQPVMSTRKRQGLTTFNIRGYNLLGWLAEISSTYLGDWSNISGYYYDDSGDYLDDLKPDVMLFWPLMPFMESMLETVGVVSANFDIKGGVDAGDSADWSTVDYGSSGAPENEALPVIEWKSEGVVDYKVWAIGSQSARTMVVSAVDTTTSKRIQQNFTLGTEEGLSDYRIKRMWYIGSGNDFYVLMKHYNSWAYYLLKVTLSDSVIGSITKTETSYEISEPSTLRSHWLQFDIDTVASPLRLWCTREHTSSDYVQLGYYDISTNPMTWTTVETYSSSNPDTGMGYDARIWYDKNFTDHSAGDAAGGLKVLRSSGGDYAVCFMGWRYISSQWRFVMYFYDDSKTEKSNGAAYDFSSYTVGGAPALIKDFQQGRYPVTGGRGSVGGFYNTTDDLFVFLIPSIELTVDTHGAVSHAGILKAWTPGAAWSIATHTVSDTSHAAQGFTFEMLRSMSSSGTANYGECCTGIIYRRRESFLDCMAYMKLFVISWDSSGNVVVEIYSDDFMQIADGTESFPRRKWPIISPPSLTFGCSSQGESVTGSVEDRAFKVYKSPGGSTGYHFICVYSHDWFWNVARNFSDSTNSIYDEFADIFKIFSLVGFINYRSVSICKRAALSGVQFDISESLYVRDSQIVDYEEGYAGVIIEAASGSSASAGDDSAARVFRATSNYLVSGKRLQKRADDLYDLWKDDRAIYEFEGRNIPIAYPTDVCSFTEKRATGKRGKYTGSEGIVLRVEHRGMKNKIQILRTSEGVLDET